MIFEFFYKNQKNILTCEKNMVYLIIEISKKEDILKMDGDSSDDNTHYTETIRIEKCVSTSIPS